MSAEFDVVRKLRLVTLEMGTWGRELLGCSSNLTAKMVERDFKKGPYNMSHEQLNKLQVESVLYHL